MGLVSGLLFQGIFQLNMMILIAALFGLSEAFLYPAILSLLPQIVSKSYLTQANVWLQGSEQITNVIGPAAAGIVIGAMGLPTGIRNQYGSPSGRQWIDLSCPSSAKISPG